MTQEDLFEFIMNEVRATAPIIEFMEADDMVHGGLISKTGQRADTNFSYSDPEKAREKAEAIGSTAIQQPATIKGKAEEQKKDKDGNPEVYKSGPRKGEPKMITVEKMIPNPYAGKWFVGAGLITIRKNEGS